MNGEILSGEVRNVQEGTEIAVARTGRKKFLTALLAGLLALGGIIAMFGLSATAFALPMGGMGDRI